MTKSFENLKISCATIVYFLVRKHQWMLNQIPVVTERSSLVKGLHICYWLKPCGAYNRADNTVQVASAHFFVDSV